MICARCGEAEVHAGVPCPGCGAVVVAPDLLDSVLSMPAEPVPEDLDEEPASFSPLAFSTAPSGPMADAEQIDDVGGAPVVPPAAVRPPVAFVDPASLPVPSPAPPPLPPESGRPAAAPLPRRTSIDATVPQWGPRDHPPAVMAPPPPHPLDAPSVARVKRPTTGGTGLPAGLASAGPAPVPVVPAAPAPRPSSPPGPAGAEEPLAVPDRPTHPRVRRWFGRGSDDAPEAPEDVPAADVAVPVADDGPFVGAPAGMLDGVIPEPDAGAGVHDPAGIEAASSRLSAGARRSALAPLATVAALLEAGEVAEAVVQGEYQHRPGVVVLTDRRVVVANDRRWAPDVRTFALDPRLVVHGWQDDRRATLVLVVDAVGVVVEAIADRPLARDLAQRIRARCGGEPSGSGTA